MQQQQPDATKPALSPLTGKVTDTSAVPAQSELEAREKKETSTKEHERAPETGSNPKPLLTSSPLPTGTCLRKCGTEHVQ